MDVPKIEDIPVIRGASVNGIVEIMRGCPRGCRFCSVTLRPLRFIPLDIIEKEVLVNVRAGVEHGIIHSEDVLLYGARGVMPREEPLIKLHDVFLRHYKSIAWAHASLAAIVAAEQNGRILTKLTEMIYSKAKQDYLGVEVGIETGSPRLAKEIMPAKSAPYPAEKWPEVVEEAFAIMHDHRIIPAATFILNFPGETPSDVMKTVELIEQLRPFRSLIVPMLFVPMGALKGSREIIAKVRITREHIEAYKVAVRHTVYWARDIMEKFYLNKPMYLPLKKLLDYYVSRVQKKVDEIVEELGSKFTYKELALKRPET